MVKWVIVAEKDNDINTIRENQTQPNNTDRWFDAQLVRLYNDIANEPLPDELEKLLQKLKESKNTADNEK